jgi:hypothetical protein
MYGYVARQRFMLPPVRIGTGVGGNDRLNLNNHHRTTGGFLKRRSSRALLIRVVVAAWFECSDRRDAESGRP